MTLWGEMEAASTSASALWMENTINRLQNDDLPLPDMFWVLENGQCLPDYRGIYARHGGVLSNILQCSADNSESSVSKIEVSGHLTNPVLLRMVRVYCHCGVLLYGRKETAQDLLKRFQCCDLYELTAGRAVLQNIIVDRMDTHTALATFNEVACKQFSDNSLCEAIDAFIKRYSCEVLCRSSLKLSYLTLESVPHLCELMTADDANISESKLLECLYSICCRRGKGGRTSTELFLGRTENGMSLWGCVRIFGLTLDNILSFREAHPNAFENGFILTLCDCVRKKKVTDQEIMALHLLPTSLLPPRIITPVSCYPRLDLAVDVTESPGFVVTTFRGDREGVSYAGVRFVRNGEVTLPPFKCFDNILQMCATFSGGYLNISGGLDLNCSVRKISDCGEQDYKHIEMVVSVINFKHQKWNSRGAVVTKGREFSLKKIISIPALDNSGYRFDPVHHPEYVPGNYILFKIESSLQTTDDFSSQQIDRQPEDMMVTL
jgi:hypothetical protein